MAQPGRRVAAPERARRIVGEGRGGQVGLGLAEAAGHDLGRAPKRAELRVLHQLGLDPGVQVQHADGLVGQLRADQEAGQAHAGLDPCALVP